MLDPQYRVHHINEQRILELIETARLRENMARRDELEIVICKTVDRTLERMGVDVHNPEKMRRNFHHLDRWADVMDRTRIGGFMSFVTLIVSGVVVLVIAGFVEWIKSR